MIRSIDFLTDKTAGRTYLFPGTPLHILLSIISRVISTRTFKHGGSPQRGKSSFYLLIYLTSAVSVTYQFSSHIFNEQLLSFSRAKI